MALPSVTVVIPCFNHGAFVRRAVDSALAQARADVRIVVVEDGSTDGTTRAACDACAGDRVRVIHQENRGLPAARNRGAAGATGEYLVFLDADDWIEPGFCSRLAEEIGKHEQVSRCGGEQVRGAGNGSSPAHLLISSRAQPSVSHAYCQERLVEKGTGIWRVPEWDPVLLLITNLHPVTALVRRECFEAVGGFDETMRNGYEDWDLWLKFVERGWRGVRVREPLFVWRRHSDTTMIMNVIHDHEALYAAIRSRHRGLYEKHSLDLIVRTNAMMRRFDMNWLDEEGEPINLRALNGQKRMYESMVAVRLERAIRRIAARLPWGGKVNGGPARAGRGNGKAG
jgi:glycosyltransferase involved in cell wall biosynthesis